MLRIVCLIIFTATFLSFSAQHAEPLASYQRYYKNEPVAGDIYLYKDGTFLTQLSGGCDGRIESRGKWTTNKDTLNFAAIESRMMDDPWKKSGGGMKFLMKKQKLVSFVFIDNKMVVDSNEYYRKIKSK